MAIASQFMTLEDYLHYDDGTATHYELEDGELLRMPPGSDLNQRVASFLFAVLVRMGIPFYRIRIGAEIVVSGARATMRVPDLMVLSKELAQALEGASRSTVTLDMPPPQLVVEVVSPGKENEDRDYRYRRSQYESRGIAEYWIVDPSRKQVTVLRWVEGLYEDEVFTGDGAIASPLLSEFNPGAVLTAAQVLQIEANA